ncbi:MAG: glycoside hydrolase 100 family protein [Candidatus Thiodiazotropha sp. (ex Epidulcina cf. delphinae)]|nr:glycoside hydrolase 100 family protein [Candidatus Thiodiazotropha sp. (ex Epidulcina cf. delphinae)]
MTEYDPLLTTAWDELEKAVIFYRGEPVGTVAARDPQIDALNYDQCFTRDFAVSAAAFLMRGRTDIVRNFLTTLVELQSRDKHLDCFRPGQGLMPASFGVKKQGPAEVLVPDFGEHAIARVAPVDSGLWWLILLRAYTRVLRDVSLAREAEFQHAIRLVLELCLTPRFDMYPTMLVPDGGYMIDRRMGVYGYPFDIQALLFAALSAARELLAEGDPLVDAVTERLGHLTYHLRRYYWLDFQRLNEIYRFRVEEYGSEMVNTFNIYPDSIPDWVMPWVPSEGGYFVGNLGPGRMDFRYFAQGNLLALLTSLASDEQAAAIMDLMEKRWEDLVGSMPLKLCFPALADRDWQTVTGADPKNSPWSYHNGGNWPFLLWLLAGGAIKAGCQELAHRALDIAASRITAQHWPEYYDGRDGRFIGKEARSFQTWSIAGFIAAHEMLAQPQHVELFSYEENPTVVACSLRVADEMAHAR